MTRELTDSTEQTEVSQQYNPTLMDVVLSRNVIDGYPTWNEIRQGTAPFYHYIFSLPIKGLIKIGELKDYIIFRI